MGRPRRFDESALLDAAIEQFWSKGFDNTSVEDISAIAGIGNGSIYAAYGNKRGLFLAAFDRYCDRRAAFIRDTVLTAPGSARAAMRTLLHAVIADCAAQPGRRGCLMINGVAALAGRVPEVADTAAKTTAAMEHSVAERLRRTATDHDDATIEALSAHVILVAQGLILSSRHGADVDQLHGIAEISLATLPPAWADRAVQSADTEAALSR
ncbi:TetR/AcrR family transcriptional regulator [Nocardia sp. NPDC058058]|uniref:TetR/AcrR family transcriptional regulator n=1 Tax=Nocardia sp. NPDC058058 TaxID=3346317 RepID=UPI0036DED493